MSRPKRQKPVVVVERGRNHRRFVDTIIKAAESGDGISIDEVHVLIAEIRDLRAVLHTTAKSG